MRVYPTVRERSQAARVSFWMPNGTGQVATSGANRPGQRRYGVDLPSGYRLLAVLVRDGRVQLVKPVTVPRGRTPVFFDISGAGMRFRPLFARPALRRRPVRRPTMLRGFGDTEEVVEETVEEIVPAATGGGAKMAVGVAGVALVGLGLFYGLTQKSYTGQRVFRGAV